MLRKPTAADARLIAHFLGRTSYIVALAAALPAAWAGVAREWSPFASFVLMVGVFCVFGALGTSVHHEEQRLDWSHGMVVVALTWLLVPAIGSIPLILSGHFGDPLDAFFDAMSGLSTTGLSVLQDLDHLAPSLNFWRHLLHFLGGQGIILAALSLFAGGAGMTLFYGEGRDEKIFPSVTSTARFIWAVSIVHLVFGVALLAGVGVFSVGLTPLRAVFHGLMIFMAGFDTGGFSPQSTSIGYYHSAAFEAATAVMMVAGAISFGLHFALWRRQRSRVFRDLETRTILGSFGVTLTLTIIGLTTLGIYSGVFGLARQSLFHVLSAHSGTGFSTVPSSELAGWGGLAFGGIAIAMALGGMASSTAGGVKALRVGITLKAMRDQVRQVLLPERALVRQSYFQAGKRRLTPELAQAVMVVSLLFVAMYLIGAGVGMAYGNSLQASLFESVSAGANVGLSVGVTSPSMPALLEVTYAAEMWLGRLEFVAVFALFGFLVAAVRGK
ncbi:MAG TPA: TrkH family potassium uptake protein [Acidimicrobiia bacterium]|nr:TrkH family potassium uptake protein [Acidimicrobiia bacterium]